MTETFDIEAACARARYTIATAPDYMVAIGGGNPYLHCKDCGVTNVELNMGEHSRSHSDDCEVTEHNRLAKDVLELAQKVKDLEKILEGYRLANT